MRTEKQMRAAALRHRIFFFSLMRAHPIRHDVITETSDKIVINYEVTIRKKSHQQHDDITIKS